MVRLAFLLTGSDETAEDVVQDAFVGVIRRWDSLSDPSAYLRVTVVNACRSWHRRRFLERRRVTPFPTTTTDEPDEMADALARLPARQQMALVLRFYEDLPEVEIAALLGCRPGTVKSLLHRALAQLRKVTP